jgi:nucleoside-diphosphate-sugar epimerase
MSSEKFLVTGALGCIGSWAVKRLLDEGIETWTYDLGGSDHRLRLILADEQLETVHRVEGDITDEKHFESVIADNGITHVIHLAALQVPFVKADPILGCRVNVVGTTIVFETLKKHLDQVKGLVYASSAGVYGAKALYPPGPLANDAAHLPPTLYGVTKQANEWTAKIYSAEAGLHSVGLRPYTVYGPGRDQGMTSSPTKAMVAAAAGRPYHIAFGGQGVYHHADEVAGIFVKAARASVEGAPVYNVGGITVEMSVVIAAIEKAVPDLAGQFSFENWLIPNADAIDDAELQKVLGPIEYRPLEDGVRESIEHFRAGIEAGKVDVDKILA